MDQISHLVHRNCGRGGGSVDRKRRPPGPQLDSARSGSGAGLDLPRFGGLPDRLSPRTAEAEVSTDPFEQHNLVSFSRGEMITAFPKNLVHG